MNKLLVCIGLIALFSCKSKLPNTGIRGGDMQIVGLKNGKVIFLTKSHRYEGFFKEMIIRDMSIFKGLDSVIILQTSNGKEGIYPPQPLIDTFYTY